jgi:hypothetical protein
LPIHDKPLRALDLRLIFWLLLNQKLDEAGMPTGVVEDGWRRRAVVELKTYREHIWAAEKRLRESGVITSRKHQRSLKINGSAFV